MEAENTETEVLEKEEKKEVAVLDVEASKNGQLKGGTLQEQWKLATAYCRSGMLPKSYNTPEKELTGMQYAYELGLSPLSALKNIAVINGQPSLWGELPLAIVRNSGKLVRIKEYNIDKDYKEICIANKNLNAHLYASICELEREGGEKKEFAFTRDMYKAQGAGVTAIWNKFESIMFKRKARSIGLKDMFGDILEGLNIAEYDYNTIPEAGGSYEMNHDGVEVKDLPNPAGALNSAFTEA